MWWYVCGGTDGAAGDPTRGARRCDRGGNLIPILPYNRATKGLGVSCAARYRVSDSEVKRIGGNEKGRNIPGWLGELHASEVKHETRGTRVPKYGTFWAPRSEREQSEVRALRAHKAFLGSLSSRTGKEPEDPRQF